MRLALTLPALGAALPLFRSRPPRSVVINMPCVQGTISVGGAPQSWSQPDYNMLAASGEASITNGNLAFFFNPPVAASVTLQAYTKFCSRNSNSRPVLYNGASSSPEVPVLFFGRDLRGVSQSSRPSISVTLTGLVVRGSVTQSGSGIGVRPCLAAAYLTSLTLQSTDFTTCYTVGSVSAGAAHCGIWAGGRCGKGVVAAWQRVLLPGVRGNRVAELEPSTLNPKQLGGVEGPPRPAALGTACHAIPLRAGSCAPRPPAPRSPPPSPFAGRCVGDHGLADDVRVL